jgi:hypothetical protein
MGRLNQDGSGQHAPNHADQPKQLLRNGFRLVWPPLNRGKDSVDGSDENDGFNW